MSMQLWKTVIKTIKVRNCVHDKEKERKDDHKSNFAYLFCIGKKKKERYRNQASNNIAKLLGSPSPSQYSSPRSLSF